MGHARGLAQRAPCACTPLVLWAVGAHASEWPSRVLQQHQAVPQPIEMRRMASIREIRVSKLFGEFDHTVTLRRRSPVTIVAGPNGVGKTHLLALTNAILKAEYFDVIWRDFGWLELELVDGRILHIEKMERSDDGALDSEKLITTIDLEVRLSSPSEELDAIISVDETAGIEDDIPPWIERIGPNQWLDTRSEATLSTSDLRKLVARRPRSSAGQPRLFEVGVGEPPWLATLRREVNVDFIETRRLDSKVLVDRVHSRTRYESPIEYYTAAIIEQIRLARNTSLNASQNRDRSFPNRLFALNKASVNEEGLRQRYSEIEGRVQQLTAVGLFDEAFDFALPRKLTPTQKRVLDLFLDDVSAKTLPLLGLMEKLDLLRRVIDRKFLHKRIEFSVEKGIFFRSSSSQREIPVTALSSGEQHELSLFSHLLFRVRGQSLIMIDEPELSLHVAWQHDLLGDLEMLAGVTGLTFLLATHSTAIINNRWDLVDELLPLEAEATP